MGAELQFKSENRHPLRKIVVATALGAAAGVAALGVSHAAHEASLHYAQMNPHEVVAPSGITADGMVDRMDFADEAFAVGAVLLFGLTGISLLGSVAAIQQSRNS
jgi:hypothetical protein